MSWYQVEGLHAMDGQTGVFRPINRTEYRKRSLRAASL